MELKVRGRILGTSRPSDVTIRDGSVVAVKRAGKGAVDIGSAASIIAPTLFDIQVNGVGGVDLQDAKVTPEDVRRITDILAGFGISCWVPTLITGAFETMEHSCQVVAEAMQDRVVRRAVPGIHLEGPHISPVDGPRGAHAKQYVREPDIREFDRLQKASGGKILFTTIAPEVKGAVRYIKALVKRGVVVSMGHHNGQPEDIAKAVDAGARLCTHLGNGLASTIHRHHNPLWPQLADDRLKTLLIPDLEHLPAEVLKIFVRAKRPENVILTSDCVHLAGLKPGKYNLGRSDVELLPSGRICLSGTDLLAGSSLLLLQGVVNAVQVTDMSLEQAFASATAIPAKALGVRRRFDAPKAGRKADMVVFDIDENARGGRWQATVGAAFVNGERTA